MAGKDFVHRVLCGISSRPGIGQFSVCANLFLRLPAVFTSREQRTAFVVSAGAALETVHKIIIGTKGQQDIRRKAGDEDRQHNAPGKDVPDPGSRAEPGIRPFEKMGKQNQGTQDLGLVFGRAPAVE